MISPNLQIEKELTDLLKARPIDFAKVMELTDRLVAQDPDFVRFTVDASHVDRLGIELVSRKEIALAELIKNSYDADAQNVAVHIGPNAVVISDDGSGMTREQVTGGFMRLSTRMKEREPRSPRLKRSRAGSKGIGRFAAQRIGLKLEIETLSDEEGASSIKLTVDWRQFDGDRNLLAIPNRIESGTRKIPGTTLTITELRDLWDTEAVETAKLFIGPLVQPFSLGKPTSKSGRSNDFQVTIAFGNSHGNKATDMLAPLYRLALAEISATVDADGAVLLSVVSDRLKMNVEREKLVVTKDRPKAALDCSLLKGVNLRAYYYIREKPWMPSGEEGKILRDALASQGGIRLYRNGFRVHPYGESGDDWLELDYGYALRRVLLYAYSNRNFMGFIEITDPKGQRFQETSSREGLLVTPAFEQLKIFGLTVLLEAVRLVNESATKQQEANIKPVSTNQIRDTLKEAVSAVDALRKARGQDRDRLAKVAIQLIRRSDRAAAQLEKRRVQEIGMLRILATLGISIVEFIHETRNSLSYLLANVTTIIRKSSDPELQAEAQGVQQTLKRLRQYTDYFNQVVSKNESLVTRPVEMHRALTDFRRFAKPLTDSFGIELDARVDGPSRLYTVEMHESEWSSILLNLLSNSIKAIRRAGKVRGAVSIIAKREGSRVSVQVSDTGDGIPDENRMRVFDPFFSTTRIANPKGNPQEDLSGMGLGLKIVKDTVIGVGGTIEVVDPADGFATTLRIVMPAASERDLADAGID